MYCTNCGHSTAEGAAYCHRCGRPLGPPEPDAVEAAPPAGLASVPWRGGQVALGVLLAAILVFPATLLAMGIGGLAGQYDEAATTWASVHLSGLSIIGVVWFLGLRGHPAPASLLGLAPLGLVRPMAILLAVLALGGSMAATFLYAVLMNAAGLDILSPPDVPVDIAFPGPAVILTFQALALVTPVTEEIFFRGFVFPGLARRLGVGWAMVASAAVFSVFHLSVGVLIPVFITGLLLAWLYRRTGSLWPSILAHAAQNGLVVALEVYRV